MMAASRISIPALVLLMLASHIQGLQRAKVDAAVAINERWIALVVADSYVLLPFVDNQEYSKFGMYKSDIGLPNDFPITAATENGLSSDTYFFYGPDFYIQTESNGRGELVPSHRNYSESLQKFFGDGGPDAVAQRDNRIFYFKGCRLATHDDSGVLKQRNAKKLGLPCKPDAAWSTTDRTKIVLLKGDQIWIWDYRKRVDGPKPFTSMYNTTSWELIPSSG